MKTAEKLLKYHTESPYIIEKQIIDAVNARKHMDISSIVRQEWCELDDIQKMITLALEFKSLEILKLIDDLILNNGWIASRQDCYDTTILEELKKQING